VSAVGGAEAVAVVANMVEAALAAGAIDEHEHDHDGRLGEDHAWSARR